MTGAFRTHRDAALRTGRKRPPAPAPVQAVTVNRAVWREAMKAAEGDGRRIRILSETSVLVVNNPRRPA